ncbi:hypothetical protein [Marilutibacter maris]|uniref:hypothetical protein n=1 Tax=Marilutibacter maris TaxID=1605891 RepID=UPI001479079A|nr:hypothetical protein [Lysobacter maris]
MSEKRKEINEGYRPSPVERGYQPSTPKPGDDPIPQGGYQPTSEGDNPANPPGEE